MENVVLNKKDVIAMKLLHFFITEKGYTPIIVHGVKDEIWLENQKNDYSIIRIMTGYIHNQEQLDFDLYKTKSLIKKIKRKTLKLKMKTLSILLDLNEDVDSFSDYDIEIVKVKEEKDLKNNKNIKENFPDLSKKLKYSEDGLLLFDKITKEINQKTEKTNQNLEKIFKPKTPQITYFLIFVNVLCFLISRLTTTDIFTSFALNGHYVKLGEYYRLITATFLHADLFHLLFNMYALYLIGSQLEGFYGKVKYLIIYLTSGILGSLLSLAFLGQNWSLGASGAIFGLFGSLLYFGYHYRVYLGTVIKTQILPIIVLNLVIGFIIPGIDVVAHLGGLIGGIFISMAVGIQNQTSKSEQINGIVLSILAFTFFIYLTFIR
ncbi:MAG: rhomboid family intramembrane serine protease [Mollicutes bacterium]|nr:rhomboid family intramembrane serine protease [Mollicutes bacterium]